MFKKKTKEDLIKEREANRGAVFGKRAPIYVIVDGIRSLDNVGLLFRLCELTRVSKLYLCGITGYPDGSKNDRRAVWKIKKNDQRIRKTAIYAVPFVPWEHKKSALSLVKKLKREGVKIYSLEQCRGSLSYTEASYDLPLALVVGNELKGVSQKIIDESEAVLEIPVYGIGNSLNVAMAAGVVLYHLIDKTGIFGKIDG